MAPTPRLFKPLALLALLALCLTQGTPRVEHGPEGAPAAVRSTDVDGRSGASFVAAEDAPDGPLVEEREVAESEEDEESHPQVGLGAAAIAAAGTAPEGANRTRDAALAAARCLRCCDAPRGPPVARA